MRFALFLIAGVCWAQPATVTGRAVNALTGAPLKDARVWQPPAVPVAATNVEGRFSIENVPPGQYLLVARRGGYLKQGGEAPFELAPKETLRDVVVKLTPQSLIAGKVVDENGEAVPQAQISVRRLATVRSSASQDDRYSLRVADGAPAIPVDVAAGAELRGITLRMPSLRRFGSAGARGTRRRAGPRGISLCATAASKRRGPTSMAYSSSTPSCRARIRWRARTPYCSEPRHSP